MAPFLFRGVKGVSISCTSPASEATCTSYGGREFDRRRRARNWAAAEKQKSCPQKTRKSSEITGNLISPASSSRYLLDEEDDGPFFDPDEDPVPALTRIKSARFQIVTGEDSAVLKPSRFSASYSADSSRVQGLLRPSSASLSSSSRPSLPSTRLEITSGDDSPVPSLRSHTAQGDDRAVIKQSPLGGSHARAFFRSSSSLSETRFPSPVGKESDILSSSARTPDQVVVLRVSLHCKGCEAKVKKHLSRMEGVRSFDVDFATKKVTVVGDVTPLAVLSSFSKVKNAQLWASSSPAMALI